MKEEFLLYAKWIILHITAVDFEVGCVSTVDPPKLCWRWQSGHLCEAGANQSSESPHGECGGFI